MVQWWFLPILLGIGIIIGMLLLKWRAFVNLVKQIGVMLTDQAGAPDDKRVMGVLIILFAMVYVSAIKLGDIYGFLGIAGLGSALLGVAAPLADQGKLGGP